MKSAEELFSAAEDKQNSGEYGEAIDLYMSAAEKFQASDLGKCAEAYAKAGILLELVQRNVEASECLSKGVAILEKLGLKDERFSFYCSHLGFNYFVQEKYGKAAESYVAAAEIYVKVNSFRSAAENYWRAGVSYKQQADYQSAEECYLKALKLCEESGDKYQQAVVLGLLGILYGDAMKRHEEAASMYLKSGELFKELGDMNEAREKYVWAFQSYLSAGKVDTAEKLMLSINKIFPENNNYYI
ncbi:MAG: tetratricopeptide repeat protein [Candidatus Freyarchaeota archaeon]